MGRRETWGGSVGSGSSYNALAVKEFTLSAGAMIGVHPLQTQIFALELLHAMKHRHAHAAYFEHHL